MPANVRLLVYNPHKHSDTLTVHYRIEDYDDKPVVEKKLSIPLEGKTHLERRRDRRPL